MTRALAVAIALLWCGEAWAAPCVWLPHAVLADKLKTQFGEQPANGGVTKQAYMLQIFRTKGGETWSAVVVRPEGLSCIVAAGTWWIDLRPSNGDPT